MDEYGSFIVPLSVVGMFMNYCGNYILHFIYSVLKKKVFYPSHKVISIQLLNNGEVNTLAVRKQCIIKRNDANGQIQYTEQEQTVQFRSKAIVISNGGQQGLHPAFYREWFPFMSDQKEKVVLADEFLRKNLYLEKIKLIKQNEYKNIVIIGGSHSGFSAAWMILHGPSTYNHNNSIRKTNFLKFPEAPLKHI